MSDKKPADVPPDDSPTCRRALAAKRAAIARKRSQARTTHGRFRATKGTIRRTPLHADEYDPPARVKAREVYRGLPREWAPERETYRELYGAKLRGRARLDLRGWYDSRGEQKEAGRQWFELVERLEAMERRAREAKAELDGGPTGSVEDARAKITALAARWPGALEFRICLADGTPFSFGGGDAPERPMRSDPLMAEGLGLPAPSASPEAADRLPLGHPLDAQAHPAPLPPARPKDNRSPAVRAWLDGSDLD